MKHPAEIIIQMPDWMESFIQKSPVIFSGTDQKMRFVIDLARGNIKHNSGGPFAAAIFDEEGRLIAPGVNMVVAAQCSVLHAEIVALMLAQKILGRYDISDSGKYKYELATAAEPCAMCFGAVHWSGITRLVCGARDEDARAIGFDEGPKIDDWIKALNDRGIAVERDVLRNEAIAVLHEYAKSGGIIYNPRHPFKHDKF
jgi:tRNA(Arg) A34 adenosine deaminase TadA